MCSRANILIILATLIGNLGIARAQQQIVPDWASHQPTATQYLARQPIAADLQNQVNALSAQLAAANRQLSYYEQQLSLVSQQQQPQQQAPLHQHQLQPEQLQQLQHQQLQSAQPIISGHPINLAQHQLQQPQHPQQIQQIQQAQQAQRAQQAQVQQSHQFALPSSQHQPEATGSSRAQLMSYQQLALAQLLASQPQVAPAEQQLRPQPDSTLVSTLVDGSGGESPEPQRFGTNLEQVAARTEVQRQRSIISTTASPTASIEPSFTIQAARAPSAGHQLFQQPASQVGGQAQLIPAPDQASVARPQQAVHRMVAPSLDQPPPHNPPKNDDKFSIGLGVLSPGYTQKFGNTALDFNQDKNGFSFTLSNGHKNDPRA